MRKRVCFAVSDPAAPEGGRAGRTTFNHGGTPAPGAGQNAAGGRNQGEISIFVVQRSICVAARSV